MTRPHRDLDERERHLLDFERDWTKYQGGKGAAIRARFGISSARYYQLLARVVEDPAALAYDPLTVRRVRRRRAERARRRAAPTRGTEPGR